MKVYIVTSSYGQYEDYSESISAVYINPFKAEEAKRKIEAKYKYELDNIQPEPDMYNETSGWEDWFSNKCEVDNYNCTYVTEHEVIE